MPTPSADEDGERYAERQRRYFDRVLALALGIGAGLLSSGASVSRVETAVKLICLACGAREVNVMSFPSVIICSVRLDDGSEVAQLKRNFRSFMTWLSGLKNFSLDMRHAKATDGNAPQRLSSEKRDDPS